MFAVSGGGGACQLEAYRTSMGDKFHRDSGVI